MLDIDFEGTAQETTTIDSSAESNSKENEVNVNNQEEIESLDGSKEVEDINDKSNREEVKEEKKEEKIDNDANSLTGELHEGDQLEFDGNNYKVDANGNLVDEKGNIFKEAKDVADWLKSVDVEDKDKSVSIDINTLQEAIGISITDSNGNDIEFTNDVEGVKGYINSVIDIRSKELQEAAVNRLYSDNPLLKQFQDYVQINGTARGFGEIPDRSNIVLDKDNEAQQVAIIKMAAKEFGNKSLNDNYIKYLKDSGSLYDEARQQLASLIDKDKAYIKEIETEAKKQREQDAKDTAEYWNRVNNVINGRMIGSYKLPESFTKEVDGKKVVMTLNDFFDYVSKPVNVDNSGNRMTGYQKSLSELSDDEYLNREMLDAWLMFTGGTYKDLIDMAVKEEQVRQLKVKSKEQRANKSVKIIRKPTGKVDINDILL